MTATVCAQASVTLKARSRDIYAGEAFPITIEIRDFQSHEPPEIPELPGCTILQSGGTSESSQTSIVNGRITQSRTLTYHYELTPHAIGELVVPPIPVLVDGQVLRTRSATFQVYPSDSDQFLTVEISAGRNRIYVGQLVQLTMTIWIKPPRYGNQRLEPGYVLRRIQPLNFGPFPHRISNADNVGRFRAIGQTKELFYAYDFATDFVAERPGRLAFDDISVGLEYPIRGGTRNLRARPVVEPIEVLPVPMEGRPASFSGAVGLFDIKTTASPTDVRVGDPIELTIEIFGEGPLETLPPPLLSANQRLTGGFRLPGERLAGEMRAIRRLFRLTIRARRDDVTEIPPIEYPYFDPNAERFIVARSDPIPLEVVAAAEIAPPDLATAHASKATASGSQLQALDGLHYIETSETVLLTRTSPVTTRLITGVMLAPPAIFLLTWGGLAYAQVRSADPARRRRQTARRTARGRIARARELSSPELPGEITAALSEYLADRLDEPPARFTGSAAVDFLNARQVPTDLIAQWTAVVQRCDETSFAGGAQSDAEALAAQALACLNSLERQKL